MKEKKGRRCVGKDQNGLTNSRGNTLSLASGPRSDMNSIWGAVAEARSQMGNVGSCREQ